MSNGNKACTEEYFNTLLSVEHSIPLLAKVAPNLDKLLTSVRIEQT